MPLRLRWLLWDTRYEYRRLREKALMAVVWRLPESIVYWSAIRLMAHATTGRHASTVVPELTAVEALQRWGYPTP